MYRPLKVLFNVRLLLSFLLVVLLFLSFDFLFQKLNIGILPASQSGIAYAIKLTIYWFLFWVNFPVLKPVKILILTLAFGIAESLPFFLETPLHYLDQENLLFGAVCMGFAALVLLSLTLKFSFQTMVLVLLFAVLPWVNLGYANHFEGNYSMLGFFGMSNWSQVVFSEHILIDFNLALINGSMFLGVIFLLQELINRNEKGRKVRLNEQQSLQKKHIVILILIFKNLVFWLLATVLVTLLGLGNFSLFSNKISSVLNSLGALFYLIWFAWFIRSKIMLFFYDHTHVKSWLPMLLFFPFTEVFAVLLLALIPVRMLSGWLSVGYSKLNGLLFVLGLIAAFALYNFFFRVAKLPVSATELKSALLHLDVFLPIIIGAFLAFVFKKPKSYFSILIFILLGLPVIAQFILPKISGNISITTLVSDLNFYLFIGLIIFFISPVFHFKTFLGLDDQ
jgi:hypothetical protein